VVESAERTEYAEQLVLLARRLAKAHALPTLGMANRSDLSTRVSALLDGNQRRSRAGLLSAASAITVASLVVVAIAPIRAVRQSTSPIGAWAPDSLTASEGQQASTPLDRVALDQRKESLMKINLTSVMVDNQDKALKFYTEVLGFVKKTEVPIGEHKWLTVVSPEGPDGIELLLEPTGFPPARTYQKALYEAGIPLTSFAVEDIQREYERLEKLGVVFKTKPTKMGPVTVAVFDDTCGNLIQIAQK
jgi:catechol 2,3-dioxygenase-like lactoylglutathione lyase family enzyme